MNHMEYLFSYLSPAASSASSASSSSSSSSAFSSSLSATLLSSSSSSSSSSTAVNVPISTSVDNGRNKKKKDEAISNAMQLDDELKNGIDSTKNDDKKDNGDSKDDKDDEDADLGLDCIISPQVNRNKKVNFCRSKTSLKQYVKYFFL